MPPVIRACSIASTARVPVQAVIASSTRAVSARASSRSGRPRSPTKTKSPLVRNGSFACATVKSSSTSATASPRSTVNETSSSATTGRDGSATIDGLMKLGEYGASKGINIIVENHGGLSSNGRWLSSVIEAGDHPRLGTLPDFGNFRISESERYDNYRGVEQLMPYARAVSAKTNDFDAAGEEVNLDYEQLIRIVLDSGYRGWIGIEYEGGRLTEPEGIRLTKALLERVREKLTPEYA